MPVKKSILVVGDDQNLYQTMAFILSRAGYLVAAGINLDEAHLYLANSSYDLVILDVKALDASSSSLIHDIAQLIPGTPMLIMSGNFESDMNGSSKVSGGSGYLLKPIDPDCILKRVQEILAKY
jgi:DNA-binding NtrC family response regulator